MRILISFALLACVVALKAPVFETLFDSPVSNHGARVRLIAKLKTIKLEIKSPAEIGGLSSPEYSKYTIQACNSKL
jgi:hypothetical protein